jgi:superfamily II DNA or RNA helicase
VTDHPFELRDVTLLPWQREAVRAWEVGDGRPFHGTLEVVTGGGKTLIALGCIEAAARISPDLTAAVVVPTKVLAHQWASVFAKHSHVPASDIAILGGGKRVADLGKARVIIAVINTAAKKLPALAGELPDVMLVVDECHRAGAPTFSRVLHTPAKYRLGLSATPDREEVDDEGESLKYDAQAVGRSLGSVVYRFTLQQAREAELLPEFEIHHHAVSLTEPERARYESLSRQVDDRMIGLRDSGISPDRARQAAGRNDDVGQIASAFVALTSERKDLLYRAHDRARVVTQILDPLMATEKGKPPRAILFHERVDEAVQLHELLSARYPNVVFGLEHSRMPERNRQKVMEGFRDGSIPVLISVKSLIEGVDIPEADLGISVAATSSVRQRIQALGRVLRKPRDGSNKTSFMHILYVDDTVDDLIYGKADWADLTGEGSNFYWKWPEDGPAVALDGPPRTPLPTEAQAWELLGRSSGTPPVAWPGVVSGQEYKVSTNGTVHNAFGGLIANPQNVGEMIRAVRGRPGGRFRVTPEHRLVLVWPGGKDDNKAPLLAGRLMDAFTVASEVEQPLADVDAGRLNPGDVYLGPTDREGGSYKLGKRAGGVIERSVPGGREFALSDLTTEDQRTRSAKEVLDAWDKLGKSFSRIHVNRLGHVWYEEGGERKFLGLAPAGFAWPSDEGGLAT